MISCDSFIHSNSRGIAKLPSRYQVVCILFSFEYFPICLASYIHPFANTCSKSTVETVELLYRSCSTISIADVEQVLVRIVISILKPVDKTLFNVATKKIAQCSCLLEVFSKDKTTNVPLLLTLNKFHVIV